MNEPTMTTKPTINLTETIKKLRAITTWFESQDEIDVEKGLERVKEGAELIKASRARLKELENEFEEVKKQLATEA
jgi:exonuclease VII small subunit